MTKAQLRDKLAVIYGRDGIQALRWMYAYKTAEAEHDSHSTKDDAHIILNGRKPVPSTLSGLVDWLWEGQFDLNFFKDSTTYDAIAVENQENEIDAWFKEYEHAFRPKHTKEKS